MRKMSNEKKRRLWILLTIFSLGVGLTMNAWTDDDEDVHESKSHSVKLIPQNLQSKKLTSSSNIINTKFKSECTSCHMAYPPGLLPEKSWIKIMNGLDKHFGEDASLSEADKKEVLDYLAKNSSDKVFSKRGQKILQTINTSETPIRISETNYFKRKHDEISESVYKRKAIGSKANCLACHAGAEASNFDEHDVGIPKENTPVIRLKK